jgi:hypothetical protein
MQVDFKPDDNTIECTCMCYNRNGYLCRHAFLVFTYNGVDKIPPRYIKNRWKRDALPKSVHGIKHRLSADTSEETAIRNEVIDTVTQCMDRLRSRPEQLSSFRDELLVIKTRIFGEIPDEPSCNSNRAVLSNFYGHIRSGPDDVVIRPPHAIRRKGRPSERRVVGDREKSINKRNKTARLCSKCKKFVYDHNARTCGRAGSSISSARVASMPSVSSVATPCPVGTDAVPANTDAAEP